MRKPALSSILVLGVTVASGTIFVNRANAQTTMPTLTYSGNTASGSLSFVSVDASTYNPTDFSTTIYIPLFDSSRGVLQSVTIKLDTGFYSTETITNTSTSSASQVNDTSVEVDVTVSGGPNDQFDTGNGFSTATVASATDTPFTLAQNNTSGNNPGSTTTETFGSASAPVTTSSSDDTYFLDANSSDPTEVANAVSFEQAGGGTTTAQGQTGTFTSVSFTGGNAVASQVTMAKLSGTITYNFMPTPATPGDVSMVMGLAIGAFLTVRRRKQAVANS